MKEVVLMAVAEKYRKSHPALYAEVQKELQTGSLLNELANLTKNIED